VKWTNVSGVVHQNPLSIDFPAFLFQKKWTDFSGVVHLTGAEFRKDPRKKFSVIYGLS